MDLHAICDYTVTPALTLLPPAMGAPQARVLLLAIGLQESRFLHRRQVGGPARGFWQFEQGGGVRGVLKHAATYGPARRLCAERDVAATAGAVYTALEADDVLAAGFARLLLWTDPHRLPDVGDADSAWALYLRTWRPGKPHPHTWPALYAQAMGAIGGRHVRVA
ncbi:MAG: hypothetical protein QHC88_13475 [Achromobacter sp.]|uniref:hypothetical protein n=1 Tax=Achromobacter sp. TaxID=134375 RepID=UPI0029AB058A|nr:hypothetical protein [Achromobacter sp.]MDX3986256.1 hypothetical protein [Achromobacter sp.]